MKKLILIIIAMFGMNVAFGQTTIWLEDFESYTLGTGIQGDGANNVGDYPISSAKWTLDVSGASLTASTDYIKTSDSFGSYVMTARDTDGDAIWLSEDIDISGFTDVNLSARFHESGTMEAADHYKIEYQLDGGSWTTYSTNGTQSDDYGGWDTASQSGLLGSTLKIRVTLYCDASKEYQNFDDVKVEGTPASTNDTDSEAADSTQPAAATISSLIDTSGEAIDVFKMDIYDWGTADGLPTKVTKIRLKPHTTNTADWTNNIQGISVYKAGTVAPIPASLTITDTAIDFAINIDDLNVSDETTATLTFALYLNTSKIEDGKILSFMVDADDHGFTADSSGSTFAATFSGGDFNSNDFTIGVVATEMQFTQQPSDVEAIAIMSPAVTVAYTDANGNIDIDATDIGGTTANLTATGDAFALSTTTENEPTDGIMTFSDIKFNDTATGVTLTVTDNGIILNDGDNVTSTTFDVTGEPEILIEDDNSGLEITDGDTTPNTTDHTDFGYINTSSGSTVSTFIIKNTGNDVLNLTDPSPYVTITGSGDFTLSSNPSSPINPVEGETSFSITFDPSSDGLKEATISIANDDSNEDPYTFDIQGIGYTPTISFDSATSSIIEGDSGTTVLHVTATMDFAPYTDTTVDFETGDDTAIGGSDFVDIPTTTRSFNVGDTYPKTVTIDITINGDITVEDNETFEVTLGNISPANAATTGTDKTIPTIINDDAVEISVEGNTTEIIDGDTTPSSTDFTDFGNVKEDDPNTKALTFTIKNTGNAALHLTDVSPNIVTISGAASGDFTVTSEPSTTIASGDSTTFTITFNPSALGLREASVSIANDDLDEAPYNFNIQGTGYTACSQLFISEYAEKTGGNYIEIYNPTNADVDMANFQVWRGYNGGAWTSADVIALSGTLAGGNVYVVARDAADIPFANKYDSHLNFNGDDNIGLAYDDGSGTFTLIDAVGDENGDPGTGWDVAGVANATVNHTLVRKASVDYANTDWDATAGTDALNSEWVVLDYTTTTQLYHVSDCQNIPLMAVVGHLPGAGNDELVIDEDLAGAQTPKKSNNTLFKNTAIGNTTINAFRIYNAGTADLSLTGSPMVAISGTDADQFSISTNPTSPVGANNGHTDFEITFTPTTEGIKTATISIANNNPFENPYTFTIQGTGYTACSQLFISEYAEKTGGNYIEIYNPTNADVDMTNFQVWRGYNGGAWSGADVIALSGTLVPGNVFIIARDASEIEFANQYDSHLNFNGNDNIGLAYDDGSGTFALIDSVGDATGNPGTAWDVAGVANATLNHTLVRKASVDYANTDWDAASGTDAINSEWIVLDYTTNTQLYHVSDCQQIPLMAVVGHLPGAGNDELVIDELLAGPQTPKASNNTLFEDQQVGVTTVSHTFRIYNAGNTDLEIDPTNRVQIIGANSSDFTVPIQPSSPVAANNGYSDFVIEFNPTDYGVRTATVSIANNNPFEDPYVFTIQGTGLNYTACNTQNLSFTDDFEDNLNDWVVTNDADPNANVVISGVFNGANSTANAALFDAPNAPNTYYVSSIEKTFANSNNLVLDFSYYFEDYRGGQITIYVNNTVVYNIYTESGHNNGTDLKITSSTDDTWKSFHLDLSPFTSVNQYYTIKIEGEAKTKNSSGWKDRVVLDELTLSGQTAITSTWDGAAWSNGVPTRTVKAILDANYDTANGNIETCACQVNSSATLTVNAGEHLLIETDFENNGTVEVKDKGSIVQHKEDALVTGADKFKIHKTTATYASYDYIYWSSPMTVDTFDNVFIANLAANEGRRIYSFNTANFSDTDNDTFDDDGNDWNMVDFSSVMTPGIGYIVMGTGSSFPLTNPLTTSSQTQSVVFLKGVINNGDITVPVVLDAYNVANPGGNAANTNANLIGNPYPSAIDIKKLSSQIFKSGDNDNGVLEGTFYFWTHDDPIGSGTNNGPDLYNFSNDDYSVATVDFGGVFSATQSSNSEGDGPYTASEFVASGQAFFADAHKAGDVIFTNNMRITDHNDTFRNTEDANNDLDRVWLNLTKNDRGIFRQIMVGFHDNATDDFVNGQDGARMENGSNTDFYSIIPGDSKHYAIQNLSTFNTSKTVGLGLEIIEDGTYEIDIDHVVGVFAEDQIVYLQDNETDTIWDLTNNGAYQFVATIGDNINNRFVLRFTTTALGITDNSVTTQIIVAQNAQSFNLSTSDKTAIKSASVFNTLGQQLGYYKANNGEIQIPTSNINQGTVLFISVTLDNGARLTKKVVKL